MQQQEQMEERQRELEAAQRLEQSRAEDERRKRDEETKRQPRGSDERSRKSLPPPQQPKTSRQPAKKVVPPPRGLYKRASAVVKGMSLLVSGTAMHLTGSPAAFLRTALFLLALATAFGRRDIRERILRVVRAAMEKVRRTATWGRPRISSSPSGTSGSVTNSR